ncbi:MAG: hypothetical protein LQ340_004270 [Diploschistes diacapsis]|nr:MAG: hypothetical protein LQ340_004270 [Diploschistes diacapsis]
MANEFPVPIAKKVRLSPECSIAPPQTEDNVDDFDDFYGHESPLRDESHQDATVSVSASNPLVQPASRPFFSLPGLGSQAEETRSLSVELAYGDAPVQPEGKYSIQNCVVEAKSEFDEIPTGGLISTSNEQPRPVPGVIESTALNLLSDGADGHQTETQQSSAIDSSTSENPYTGADPSTAKVEPQLQLPDSGAALTVKEIGTADGSFTVSNSRLIDDKNSTDVESSDRVRTSLIDEQQEQQTNNETPGETQASTFKAEHIISEENQKPAEAGEQPEFESDSSPYESSSDDTSDTESKDDSEDSDDEGYELLDPVEQARRLMEEDGGSDEEGHGKASVGGQVRTLNEKPEEVVTAPDINVTQDMSIEELGHVEATVDNMVLIKAKITGEYQVLESGSLLCLGNRSVIGMVAETLGRVQEPLYSVRFTNADSVASAGLSKGSSVFYVPQHSTFVFTKALQSVKGSDASNIHDEEVGEDEMEFSDDEAEAEYKRMKKLQRQEKRTSRGGPARGHPHSFINGRNRKSPYNTDVTTLEYEDSNAGDELYTPLTRPSNLNELRSPGTISAEYPQEGYSRGFRGARGREQRGRGMGRGRGDRRYGDNNRSQPAQSIPNLSLPSTPSFTPLPSQQPFCPPAPQNNAPSYSALPPQFAYTVPSQACLQGFQGESLPQTAIPHNPYSSAQQSWQSNYGQPQVPLPSPNPQRQSPTQASYPYNANLPPGAFINPAFFGNQFQQG